MTQRQKKDRRTHAEMRLKAETGILQAALEIISERGVDSLTLAEAGERAGYSRALPAHYFKTKETLLVSAANLIIKGYLDLISAKTPSLEDDPAGLAHVINLYLDEGRSVENQVRAFYEILSAGARMELMSSMIAELNANSIKAFKDLFAKAQNANLIRKDVNIQTEAVLLLASLRGLMSIWMVSPDTMNIEEARDMLIANLYKRLDLRYP